jgi:acyl-coenzyme A thioesterase PaaI-like protein
MATDESVENQEKTLGVGAKDNKRLLSCTQMDQDFCGTIVKMNEARSEIELVTTGDMVSDKKGLVHSGYLYSSATFAALVALNKPNAVIVSSKMNYLAPISVGSTITIRADVKHRDSKKAIIKITGKMLDLEIMDGEMVAVNLEKHPLHISFTD